MGLTSIELRRGDTEKRTFACSRCASIETKIATDPLKSDEIVRMASKIRPPG